MTKETKQEQVTKPEDEELEELAELPEEETEVSIEEQAAAEETEEAPVVEEEAKPKRKKKEDEIVEERFYTIPLQRALVRPPKKRAPRAMQLLKIFVTKHMKLEMKVSKFENFENSFSQLIRMETGQTIRTFLTSC